MTKALLSTSPARRLPSTRARVREHTADKINRRIRTRMEDSIRHYSARKNQIAARLGELDREWDVERAIEANAATLALSGVIFGATLGRRWLILPGVVTAFLLQHALQGWCPPVPVLRRMGFRTADEINQERYALKAIRGDFDRSGRHRGEVEMALEASGLQQSGRSVRKRRR